MKRSFNVWVLSPLLYLLYITPAFAADPEGSGPILNALNWLQGTLLGNVATTAAVIAVGIVGLRMLTGRMDWKKGGAVILGCFILFGASAIVSGIQSAAVGG